MLTKKVLICTRGIFIKYVKNNVICCEKYDVVDDAGEGGCNHNDLVQLHKLFFSKMSTVSLKVFTVTV